MDYPGLFKPRGAFKAKVEVYYVSSNCIRSWKAVKKTVATLMNFFDFVSLINLSLHVSPLVMFFFLFQDKKARFRQAQGKVINSPSFFSFKEKKLKFKLLSKYENSL